MSQPAEKRMGVSDVRQNMTEVIAEVRLLGTPVVLTRRDKPQAALVSNDFYAQALRDRATIELLKQRAEEGLANEHAEVRIAADAVRGWLADAEASVDL